MNERIRNAAARLGLASLCAVLIGGCSWHRIEPRLERAPPESTSERVGIVGADAETSLSDLQAIARLWSEWRAFERVQFPFREGDPVDLVVEVRLRQRADLHRASNVAKAVVTGLSLGLAGTFIGPRISEIHDVSIRCVRGAASTDAVAFVVTTDASFGVWAEPAMVTKALDGEQMKRVASEALRVVVAGCRPRAPGAGVDARGPPQRYTTEGGEQHRRARASPPGWPRRDRPAATGRRG